MDQDLALRILLAGKSALITGEAGSGKTYLLNQFVWQSRQAGKSVAVTATTGLAATHLSGSTIHRWSRMGIIDHLSPNFYKKLTANDKKRLRETDILIIDEISMLNDYQFDILNQIMKTVRGSSAPFGGLQVVMSGDFFQLPPIRKEAPQVDIFSSGGAGFVTTSASFAELSPMICYLTGQFRQTDDELSKVLEAIRAGIVDDYEIDLLQARMNLTVDKSLGEITNLHTTNADVDRINQRELAKISEPIQSYTMQGRGGKYGLASLIKSVLAPQKLELKLGSFVMAVKNDPVERYVNGSLGAVVDFEKVDGLMLPRVKFNNGKSVLIKPDSWELTENELRIAKVTQLPLRLAYAITVHKAQGMTLDAARIDLSRAFTPGMGYVALSRTRSLSSLYLLGLNQMALTVSDEARQLDSDLKRQSQIEAMNWQK